MFTDLDRWPSWLKWTEQKESKITENRNIMCRAPIKGFGHACCGANALRMAFRCHQHDVISESAASTHALCHTHLHLRGFNSFPLRSCKSFGDWGMEICDSVSYFALHFQCFLKTAAEIPRPLQKGWSYSIFSQTANREKWKYCKPVFLKSLSELLQEFLGFTHDLKTEQSPLPNTSAFFTLALALHLNMQLTQAQ